MLGAGTSSPTGFFVMNEKIDKIRRELMKKGIPLDKFHHTHSKYQFDDEGISINKGDWLTNPYHGIIKVPDKKSLNSLLWKQGCLEILSGYALLYEQLVYYLLEYYESNIDYNGKGEKVVFDVAVDLWGKKDSLDRTPLKDEGKVKIDTQNKTKSEIGKLARKGEKMYYRWLVEDFIKKNPDHTKYWYIKNHEKIGVGKNTVERYFGYQK